MDWITRDPGILGGKPIIRGTRLSVQFVLECISGGTTVAAIASRYDVPIEAVEQAVAYAAEHLGEPDAAWAEALMAEDLARLEIFRDQAQAYRWRILNPNGTVLATSAESYPDLETCRRAAHAIRHATVIEAAA